MVEGLCYGGLGANAHTGISQGSTKTFYIKLNTCDLVTVLIFQNAPTNTMGVLYVELKSTGEL